MLSDDSVADRLSPDVRKIILALDTAMCSTFPIPCRCGMCAVALALMINAGVTAKPESHIILSTPFASDAPTAAADSSASALLRDWCAHCMMGRGRIHHHVSKKRRGLVEETNNSHGLLPPRAQVHCELLDKSVTCIAVQVRYRRTNIGTL